MLVSPPNIRSFWQHQRVQVLSLMGLMFTYLSFRLTNLNIWPLFVDEAIYIRWAQVMRAEPSLRFLPLTDGKQPLFMWLMIPFHKIFSDPVFGSRLVSVFAGLGAFLGIYFLSSELLKLFNYDHKQSKYSFLPLLAAALYAVSPYTLFFDRMALADSLLNMLAIWAMFLAIRNIHNPRLDLTLLTGATLGAAWLTKSPAIFFLMLLPALLIIKYKQILKNPWLLVRLMVSWLISSAIAIAIYNILRLGPEFHQIALRNQDYLYPVSEVLTHLHEPLVRNLKDVLGFYWILLTPTICIAVIIGIIAQIRKTPPTTLWLLAWTIGPLLAQSFLAKNVTARYFLFTTPPLLILAAIGLIEIREGSLYKQLLNNMFKGRNYLLTATFMLIFFIPSLYLNYFLLYDPVSANIPRIERGGYLEEWTAGQGIPKIVEYLRQQSLDHTLVVGTEGTWGSIPSGLAVYFNKDPRVTITNHSHIIDKVPQQLYDSLDQNQVYLVFNDERLNIPDPESVGLKLIMEFPKATRPNGTHQTLQLYQVISRPEPTQFLEPTI